MDLVYKGQTSSIVFTLQGLEINVKVYVPRESEMQLEEKFEEVRYYYMGEAVPVKDLEIISQANDMFVNFYGEEVVLEEDYYEAVAIYENQQ